MRRHVVVSLSLTLASLSLLATTCSRKADRPADETPPGATGSMTADIPTEAELAPVMRELGGGNGQLPDRLVIELARAVQLEADPDTGLLSADTELEFDPDVEGSLRQTGPSTLTFIPNEGFAPATPHRVTLESLDFGETVIEPERGAWSHEFTTPAFKLVRVALVEFEGASRRGTVELVFAGSVDGNEVRDHLSLTLLGREGARTPVTDLAIDTLSDTSRGEAPGGSTNVNVSFSHPSLEVRQRVEVRLERGVPLLPRPRVKAPEATEVVELLEAPGAKPVKILAVQAVEGTNGFHVEVVCDDDAVLAERYYWDRTSGESYGQISSRCLLTDEDAAERISFDPPREFTISPSSGGFRVFGDFQRGSYTMRIASGARSTDGGVVRTQYERSFTVPARAPSVSFLAKGRYVPRSQWRSLALRHVNAGNIDVTVRHVPAENLVFWATGDGERTTSRESNLVAQTKISPIAKPDESVTSHLDVGSLVPATTRGLVEVTISSGEASDTVRLVLTDLQLIAKRATSRDEALPASGDVRAWVLHATTLEPVSGAQVDLVRPSGQVVSSASSDRNGEVTLRSKPTGLEQNAPFALIARKGADISYLAFSEVGIEVSEEVVAGKAWHDASVHAASLYTDRGVYRPGESVHVAAIVRTKEGVAAPSGMPVILRIVDPRGQVLTEATLPINETGFVVLDHDLPDFATTGRHEAQLDIADKRIATERFHVEEFVPERMKVTVTPKAASALAGEPVTLTASARYLFGGVPANHRAELTCTVEPGAFKPRENANFHFGASSADGSEQRAVLLGTAAGTLDADGATELQCPSTSLTGFAGPGRLVASVAVFEAGSGRTTTEEATVEIHPERFAIGLSSRQSTVRAGQLLEVEGVVVDWEGRAIKESREIEITLVRLEHEYGWYYDESDGSSSHRRFLRPVTEGTVRVKSTGGKFAATLTPTSHGAAFLVRATSGKARSDLRVEGTSDWWWDGEGQSADRTPKAAKPEWLPIEVPDSGRVGEPIEIRVRAPHGGRMLLTAESDRVLERIWKDVEAGETTWSFTLDKFEPNVYVSALLVKPPHLESGESFLPDRAHGVASIRIEPTQFTLPVKLEAPDEVRSGTQLTVTIDVGALKGPAHATIAAVDEGVLSLTKFVSPDPLPDVFARRALGVETFETIGWTVLGAPPESGRGSGDGNLALGRIQAIKPVALWSGLREIPRDGKLRVTFDLPTYRGQLRIMAVVASTDKMGSASTSVVVRDPLTLQVTLPRFLAAGDLAEVPVFVTNASGQRREIELDLTSTDLDAGGKANDPAVTIKAGTKRLTLAEGANGMALFTLRVRGKSGGARLVATARAGDLSSTDTLEVPVLPSGPRSRTVQRIPLEEGPNVLTSHLQGWEPMSERSTIWVTANPYGDVFGHLDHLIHYPYGCLEQTTSSVRPALVLQHLIMEPRPEVMAHGGLEGIVKAGIDRVLSMQTPSGAFSYWPGGSQPAYWAHAYATHFLLDAKERSHPVPQDRIDAALTWMEDRITNHYEAGRTSEDDWYSDNGEPYMHFVLARAGRARKARIETLLQAVPGRASGEVAENRFMLQAALFMAGDRRFERELRAADIAPIVAERRNDWSFYSDRRRRGFMLATQADLFGAAGASKPLVNLVAEALRAHPSHWYTTQELVWGVTGLGKLVGAMASFEPAELRADGGVAKPSPQRPGAASSERTWHVTRASEYGEVVLDVPSKGEGQLFAIVTSEGVRTGSQYEIGGNGLAVTRSFVDASGVPVAAESLALGDVVTIVLTISNTWTERIANIAMVDRIPAGWEIENPRLGRETPLAWLPEASVWAIDHMDVRDDRLELFGHLEPGETKTIAYAARAVTSGRFTQPPVEAEAMYDPTLWARQPGRTVEITGPWTPVAN